MSEVNKKYQDILEDLKKHIKDEKELEYVNKKIAEISSIFLDMMDKMTEEFDERLHQLEEEQVFVSSKLKKIEKIVDEIENDIYDEEFNFDIICPYCNSEFKASVEGESQKEIECPECNNIIELDWNNDCDCEDCDCEDCDCEDCDCGDCGCEDCDCEDCDCEDCNCEDCDCEDCDCEDCNCEDCDCEDCNCEDCDCEDCDCEDCNCGNCNCDDNCNCGCKD